MFRASFLTGMIRLTVGLGVLGPRGPNYAASCAVVKSRDVVYDVVV